MNIWHFIYMHLWFLNFNPTFLMLVSGSLAALARSVADGEAWQISEDSGEEGVSDTSERSLSWHDFPCSLYMPTRVKGI